MGHLNLPHGQDMVGIVVAVAVVPNVVLVLESCIHCNVVVGLLKHGLHSLERIAAVSHSPLFLAGYCEESCYLSGFAVRPTW